MSTIYVNFSDSTKTQITAWFAGPQDPEVYPNQGTIDTSNAMWKTYYDSIPPMMATYLPPPTA